MAHSIVDFFDGIEENDYTQIVAVEVIPTAIVDGRPVGYTRKLYVAKYKEQTFTFTGVPLSIAKTKGSVVVTDTDGTQYTINLGSGFVDGSSGNAVFEKESWSVAMTHMSPHLMVVTYRRRGGALFENGVQIIDPPDWVDPDSK